MTNNIAFEIPLWAITIGTNLLQFYLLWLVVFKSSTNMKPFRFALSSLLGNEWMFTIMIGYIMDPELLFPEVRGAAIHGLARLLGKNGGRIVFAMALFFGAGVFWNQFYCLIFRYTAIQQRFDNLNGKFNRWNVRLVFMLLGYSLSAACGFIAYRSIVAPNDVFTDFIYYNPSALLRVTNDSVIILLGRNEDFAVLAFGIFVFGGFVLVATISIAFSLSIYHTIQKNANCFTSKTYKLHRQLTLLLIVQFCLPILFLIAPVCLGTASVIFLFPLPKWSGDMAVLLLCLYTFANALVTLVFITPYRVYTLKLLGWQKTIQHPPHISSLMRTTRVEIPALDETN